MHTLFFRESPLLVLYITIIFGIIDQTLRNINYPQSGIVIIIYVTVLGLLMVFYRVPYRVNQYPSRFIVAPSDGVVKSVLRMNKRITHIAIYLNIFDAHVQWSPINGKVISVRYKEGRFHPAYLLEKSKYNERVETTIYSPMLDGTIKIVQIAGQLARRIATYVKPGDHLSRGELFGLIKFSSRVDVFLPSEKVNVLVKEGDRLLGNTTILGEIL